MLNPSSVPNPLVSIVVPAFNSAGTLGETLASVAGQTWRNLEIIIVDDGSTDSTPDLAIEFCDRDGRAVIVRKDNGGVASARNAGIAAANGKFVALIDADDLWHPLFIARCLEELEASDATLAFSWFRLIDEAGGTIASGRNDIIAGNAIREMAFVNLVGNGSGMLVRRDALVSIGGYAEELRNLGAEGCEDYLLQLSLIRDFPAVTVPAYLVGYRIQEGSMSQDVERMTRSFEAAVTLFVASSPRTSCKREFVWHRAHWQRRLAIVRLRRGQWREAALVWTRSMILDPAALLADLAYGTALRIGCLARLLVRPSRGGGRPSFQSLDPVDSVAVPSANGLPRSLEKARLRRLAAAASAFEPRRMPALDRARRRP